MIILSLSKQRLKAGEVLEQYLRFIWFLFGDHKVTKWFY